MQQFRDRQGGEWLIDLSIGCVDRVKSESNGRFDLWSIFSESEQAGPLHKAIEDFPSFWELLWILVRPQAESRGIDPEQFGEAMAADCLIDARTAFDREWAVFLRGLQKLDQALVLEKMAAYREKMVEMIKTRLDDLNASDLDGRVEGKIRETLDNSLTNLQESLDSILGDSPGEK
jgi:hypothetical protein